MISVVHLATAWQIKNLPYKQNTDFFINRKARSIQETAVVPSLNLIMWLSSVGIFQIFTNADTECFHYSSK